MTHGSFGDLDEHREYRLLQRKAKVFKSKTFWYFLLELFSLLFPFLPLSPFQLVFLSLTITLGARQFDMGDKLDNVLNITQDA